MPIVSNRFEVSVIVSKLEAMLKPIRNRLFASFLAILLLGMGSATMLAWRSVEALYLDSQRENLLAQAQITASTLQGQTIQAGSAQPYMQTSNVAPGIHTRLLETQGVIAVGLPLPEGEIAMPPAENGGLVTSKELLQRAEIAQALQGRPATAIRVVAAAGYRRVLYAAAPVLGADGEVTGMVYMAMPLPEGGLPSGFVMKLAGALLVAVLLAAIAGTLLARRIARPIETISRAATAVSAGAFSQQVPEKNGILEMDNLGKAFNAMTASLQQSNQAKNAFIADVTHELRTPLTVIKGTIETLEDGAIDDAAGRGPLLSSMHRETERLIRLVNDLLVLTRADAGSLHLKIQPVDLTELARARSARLTPLSAKRQIHINVTPAGSPSSLFVAGDIDRLAQVLDNLLDNALRYSPDQAEITVSIEKSSDFGCCSVHDRGPGIPAEHLPYIFERFYRVDASRSRQAGGAGLGLAIAQALVLAHKGRIEAESVVGQGTTMLFYLPLIHPCPPKDLDLTHS